MIETLDGLVVADIGNNRIKLNWDTGDKERSESVYTPGVDPEMNFPLPSISLNWVMCSVSPTHQDQLLQWVSKNRPRDHVHQLTHRDATIGIRVEVPEQVGMDRLMAATAASKISQGRDVVVIDAGTAVTIDAVSNNEFLGGTIAPGSQTEFEALRSNAEQLPLVDELRCPSSILGKNTAHAIQAGVMYGQIGSITFVAQQIAKLLNDPVFVATGGGMIPIREHLPNRWLWVPGLVTDGIRITADHLLKSAGQ